VSSISPNYEVRRDGEAVGKWKLGGAVWKLFSELEGVALLYHRVRDGIMHKLTAVDFRTLMNIDQRVDTLGISDCTRVRVSVGSLDRRTIILILIVRPTI